MLRKKSELIIETKIHDIVTCTESKIDSKVARNEETESVGKAISREKPPPEKLGKYHENQRNIYDIENDNNEENRLIIKDTNNKNNNNEDDCLHVNGSNIEIDNNKTPVKSNRDKLAFILGDSIVKDVDGYLLTKGLSPNKKINVKVRPFLSAETIDIKGYTKPTKRDFNPDLYILHVGTNDLSLNDTPEVIPSHIIDTAISMVTEKTKIIVSNIFPRSDKYKEKGEILSKMINKACHKENIPVINHNSISSKRLLNRSKLHFNNFRNSVLLKMLFFF